MFVARKGLIELVPSQLPILALLLRLCQCTLHRCICCGQGRGPRLKLSDLRPHRLNLLVIVLNLQAGFFAALLSLNQFIVELSNALLIELQTFFSSRDVRAKLIEPLLNPINLICLLGELLAPVFDLRLNLTLLGNDFLQLNL